MNFKRFLAGLIDNAIALFLAANIYLFLSFILSNIFPNLLGVYSENGVKILNFSLFLSVLLGFLFGIFNESKSGANFGKKIFSLKIEDSFGFKINFLKNFIRNLPKIIVFNAVVFLTQFESVEYRLFVGFLIVSVFLINLNFKGKSLWGSVFKVRVKNLKNKVN